MKPAAVIIRPRDRSIPVGEPDLFQVSQANGHVERSGRCIKHGNAKCQKSAGNHPHDQVFEGRLVSGRVIAPHGDENIKRQGKQLKAQEKHYPVGSAGHQRHSQNRKDHQPVEFIAGHLPQTGMLMAEQQREKGDQTEEHVEKAGIAADIQHVEKWRPAAINY